MYQNYETSLGFYLASRKVKARVEQSVVDSIATLSSIPDVSIGVASAMLPDPDTKRLVWLRGVVLPFSSVDNLGDAASPLSDNISGLEAVVFVSRTQGREDRIPLEQVNYSKKELLNLSHRADELTIEEVTEEKALSQGTVVTAIGFLNSDKGIPTIEPSETLPFFVTTKSKEQMIEELSNQIKKESFTERLHIGMSACLVGIFIGTFIGIACKRLHY
ncbi:hypothetical protein KSS87_014998 [Heliosperma pusillum]|nr:hypothetical protein KSS87_014998 [Heliosperma pusillum]